RFGEQWKNQLLDIFRHWDKFTDIVNNNFDLGRKHLQLGNLGDALFRFKFVLWMEPKHADALYSLGRVYMMEGRTAQARQVLQKSLALKPGNEDAAYMLLLAGGGGPAEGKLTHIPEGIAREHFDMLAPTYNEDQLTVFKYQGHVHLCNALRAFLVP